MNGAPLESAHTDGNTSSRILSQPASAAPRSRLADAETLVSTNIDCKEAKRFLNSMIGSVSTFLSVAAPLSNFLFAQGA
jgi:hypothetical protein